MLAVGDARWVQAEWQLRGKAQPAPHDQLRFGLDLSLLDADRQTAIARARRLEPAHIDGVPARVELQTVELHFATYVDQTEPYGEAWFVATVDQIIPFPRSLDDTELARALAKTSLSNASSIWIVRSLCFAGSPACVARISRRFPLVLRGCASWMAAAGLKEAGTALTWSVAPRPSSRPLGV